MGYPNSVYAPAAKANGQVIQPSFFNDPETEIIALENAAINGFPHAITISTGGLTVSTGSVNFAGPSSLATLQVNSGSTFAGPVTFSSGVTFSAAPTFSTGLTVSTGVIRQNSLPMWILSHSTHVLLAANSSAGMAFDTEDAVRGNIGHSTGANSSRLTINTTGVYHVAASARVTSTNNPVVKLHIRLNDTTDLVSAIQTAFALPFSNSIQVNHDIRMASSGYLTCVFVSSGGHPSTIGSSAASQAIRFSGHFVG